jgi:large conductance mechanosensitive channel
MAETSNPQNQTKVTETKDGSIKITQPKGRKHKGVTVLLDTDDVLRAQAGGFANFLREYAVVGLAVGFIVGQQANGVAKQLVTSFLDPLVQVWFGQDLSSRVATVHHHSQPVRVPWGAFVYTLIEFFFVVIVIYALVKLFRLDKLRKKDT